MPEAVVVATARSPIGRAFKGSLRDLRPDDLAATVIRSALEKVPALDPHDVDDLVLGCGMPGGEQGFNMARVVAVLLGLDDVPGMTLTRYCASSLQAIRLASHAVKAGEGDVFVCAGVEMVSRSRRGSSDNPPVEADADPRDKSRNPWVNPTFAPAQQRTRQRAQSDAEPWCDPRVDGEIPDVHIAMGHTAENVAELRGITREMQDEFACRSQNLAEKAIANGFWQREITPVELPDGTLVEVDDGPRPGVTVEALAALQPVFRPDGTVTAGNCCPLNDGAAAVVVMSDVRARELGLTPLARIVSTGLSALSPEIMGLGPVKATRQALARAGMRIDDIDLVEMNEAFAAQVIPSYQELGIDLDRLNVNGGSIAVGHPFGMTGARITTTLLNSLQFHDKTLGLETMCVGGGQGMAMIFERLS